MSVIDQLRPWNPEQNRNQAWLAIGAVLGEGALTLAGVAVVAATGHAEAVPAVVGSGAALAVATGVTAVIASRS